MNKFFESETGITLAFLVAVFSIGWVIFHEMKGSDIKPGLQHCIWQIENAIREEAPDYEAQITCKEGDSVIKFYNHPKAPVIEMPELKR